MFSGIVEGTSLILEGRSRPGVVELYVKRPSNFEDLNAGDSIAVDGICLTVEAFDEQKIRFALGPETLRVTGWTLDTVKNKIVNLERSLRLGDRLHGHLVTGHVDIRAKVLETHKAGETLNMTIENPPDVRAYIWPKGSIAINGVSLTINAVAPTSFQLGLIPETLARTNLGDLKAGDPVNLEVDNMARGLIHQRGVEK